MKPLLEVDNLSFSYHGSESSGPNVLENISFELQQNRTLAVVGESGCGKSTLAKLIMKLLPVPENTIRLKAVQKGEHSQDLSEADLRKRWATWVQMVFQDPFGSLNPRRRIVDAVSEPLRVQGQASEPEIRQEALNVLDRVGIPKTYARRFPHMFSGGQRQRICIARALILKPQLLVCDEPVSALDVSVQAQVLNLLKDLQDAFGMAYLFVSHDLSVVRHFADDVMVMYLGEVVERGPVQDVFLAPQHPYTRMLLESMPQSPLRPKHSWKGELPTLANRPQGCSFESRCPFSSQACVEGKVPWSAASGDHGFACHHPEAWNKPSDAQ